MRSHSLVRAAALAAAALFVCACHGPAEHVVVISGMTFDPPVLTIAAGDRVVWQNHDLVPHTATAPGRFDSGQVQPNATFTLTLSRKGDVDYACTLHPTMKARIVVK
jgi:plastocyanin